MHLVSFDLFDQMELILENKKKKIEEKVESVGGKEFRHILM